ncbi:MAG: hypothetical protein IPM06_17405 [Rhizobiales bacterium]|nr:hypothetical protein [Hyphomicrobiales bacterium]
MTVQRITIQGIPYDVSSIRRSDARIGTRFQARNGASRLALRAVITTYTLALHGIPWSMVSNLRALTTSTSPLTLIDEHGGTATVQLLDDLCESESTVLSADNQTILYDVTLTLTEVL